MVCEIGKSLPQAMKTKSSNPQRQRLYKLKRTEIDTFYLYCTLLVDGFVCATINQHFCNMVIDEASALARRTNLA